MQPDLAKTNVPGSEYSAPREVYGAREYATSGSEVNGFSLLWSSPLLFR